MKPGLIAAIAVGVVILVYAAILFIFSNSDLEKNTWPNTWPGSL
jgi:hypothetical protein